MKSFFAIAVLLFSTNSYALTHSVFAEEKEFNSVVLIGSDGKDQDGAIVEGYCNATVLDEKTLATAAHCVSQAQALNVARVRVEIGRYAYVTNKQGKVVRVGYKTMKRLFDNHSRYVFLPAVENKIRSQGTKAKISPNEDIALIRLSEALPLQEHEITATEFISRNQWGSIKNQLTAYQPTVVSVNPVAHLTTTDTKRKAVLNDLNLSGAWLASKSQSRVEPNDSGSPMFVKISGRLKLVALTKGQAKNIFSDWDVFCPVSGNLETLLVRP